ncbi:hypothetical protein CASFOL_010218 [Castilleja foliolosa]|uniref:F-box domain-containing protein n=1 Tax=Castilleja foliolosa TaxID=1961234 RepID=A0ABD3DRY1_9LAMI
MDRVIRKKGLTAGEGEIQFPEPIIQRIQSFLTGKEAARSAILSKSWHSAWLTRPNLDLDDTYFRKSVDFGFVPIGDFNKYAKNTIRRYEQSNLKIESFNLCMDIGELGSSELAKKLIVKALKIGATRLCLQINSNSFVLPNAVFRAENLVELSVSGCTIKLDDRVVIKCRRLESFSIDFGVRISIDTISKIVSSCPSIEKLSLLSDFYDKNESMWGVVYEGVEERGQRVDAAAAAAATAMAVGIVDNLIPRLRCLELGYVWFKTLCLGDLLSRFPLLKDFTLYLNRQSTNRFDTIFEEGIQISNSSLECIKLLVLERIKNYYIEVRRPRVKFDVPSVRKLTIECAVIPVLSFMSTPPSRQWESHVSIQCDDHNKDGFCFSTLWFNKLSELLTELSRSKTHLSLKGFYKSSFEYKVGDKIIQGLRKHELENLTIDMTNLASFSCYAIFDGLFRLCRPKLITQYYKDKGRYSHHYRNYSDKEKTKFDFLCRTLEEGINFKVSRPTQFMYGLNDLEEVNAQTFDMNDILAEWKPIPFESLLDADAPDEHVQAKQKIRLLLKWKTS